MASIAIQRRSLQQSESSSTSDGDAPTVVAWLDVGHVVAFNEETDDKEQRDDTGGYRKRSSSNRSPSHAAMSSGLSNSHAKSSPRSKFRKARVVISDRSQGSTTTAASSSTSRTSLSSDSSLYFPLDHVAIASNSTGTNVRQSRKGCGCSKTQSRGHGDEEDTSVSDGSTVGTPQTEAELEHESNSRYKLGEVHLRNKSVKKAMKNFAHALDVRKRLYGNQDARVAEVYERLGDCSRLTGDCHCGTTNHDEALKIYKRCPKARKCGCVSRVLLKKAVTHLENEEREEALRYFREALAICDAENSHGLATKEDRDFVVDTLVNMGSILSDQGDPDCSIRAFRRALSRVDPEVHTRRATVLELIGGVDLKRGALKEALQAYTDVWQTMSSSTGTFGVLERINIGERIAKLHSRIGVDSNTATSWYEDTLLPLAKKELGSDHQIVASLYHQLGILFRDEGQHDQAIACFKKEGKVRVGKDKNCCKQLAAVLILIGSTYRKSGDHSKALVYYRDAIDNLIHDSPCRGFRDAEEGTEPQSGQDTKASHPVKGDDTVVQWQNKIDFDEKLKKMETSLQLEKSVPTGHMIDSQDEVHLSIEDVADAINDMGNILLILRSYQRAVMCYECAIRLKKSFRAEGVDDKDMSNEILRIKFNLAKALDQLRSHERAIAMLCEILSEQRGSMDGVPLELCATLIELGRLLLKSKRYADAKKYFAEAVSIQEKHVSPNDSDIIQTRYNLGVATFKLGEYDEAQRYLEDVVQRQVAVYGEWSAEVATTRWTLGALYTKKERFQDAKSVLDNSIDARKLLHGGGHLSVGKAVLTKAGVYLSEGKNLSEARTLHNEAIEIFRKAGLTSTDVLVLEANKLLVKLNKEEAQPPLRRGVLGRRIASVRKIVQF